MKKIKKISVNAFENAAGAQLDMATILWNDVEVTVTKTLPLQEMLEFVLSVVESCFGDDGEYLPEIKEYAIRKNVLERYANFRMPTNVETAYMLVTATDAYETVCGHINAEQFEAMVQAIDEKIDDRLDTRSQMFEQKMNDFLRMMGEVEESTKHLFDNISADDVEKIAKSLEEKGIDEEKIVKAYMDAAGGQPAGAEPEESADAAGDA